MKNILLLSLATVLLFSGDLLAQKSPKQKASGEIDGVSVNINYHSPAARKRVVMGDLVPYGQVWRTGANNATSIEFDSDVEVEGQVLKAGRYGLFTIPGQDKWTIIFNSNADQWGAFDYSESDDVLRVDVTPEKTSEFMESLIIGVENNGIRIGWENTSVVFNIKK